MEEQKYQAALPYKFVYTPVTRRVKISVLNFPGLSCDRRISPALNSTDEYSTMIYEIQDRLPDQFQPGQDR